MSEYLVMPEYLSIYDIIDKNNRLFLGYLNTQNWIRHNTDEHVYYIIKCTGPLIYNFIPSGPKLIYDPYDDPILFSNREYFVQLLNYDNKVLVTFPEMNITSSTAFLPFYRKDGELNWFFRTALISTRNEPDILKQFVNLNIGMTIIEYIEKNKDKETLIIYQTTK